MGANLAAEEMESDPDKPKWMNIGKVLTARGGYNIEKQRKSMQGKNESQNEPKLVSSTLGRMQKSSDLDNTISKLTQREKFRKARVNRPKLSDSFLLQPELRNDLPEPQPLIKAPPPPPRITSINQERRVNKNSRRQRNNVIQNQRGNEFQPPRANSQTENNAAAGGKYASQQPNYYSGLNDELSDSLYEKCYDPMDTTLRFVSDEDTLDVLYEGFKSLRALMSCGHAVTPMSLTNHCHRLLEKGETDIVCGVQGCDYVWPLEEVCKMALLTPEEIEYFENKMFEIKMSWFDVKSCPGCKSNVLRYDNDNLCVVCTVCKSEKNKSYLFCWQCLKRWRGPAPRTDRCNNEGCINLALEALKNCPEITFKDVKGVVGCPSVRACPCCGFLVSRDDTKCKYIGCARCKKKFCFVCLEFKASCWKKSNAYEACATNVAPRQTSIPVLKL